MRKGMDFESRLRAMEYFHTIKVPLGAWVIVRVDGRGFSRFTEDRCIKPFDEMFRNHMVDTTKALVNEMKAIYAYTESDEISVLFPRHWDMFDREVEKIVSVSAGIASSTFTHSCGDAAHFDSRIWLGIDREWVVDYFRWRQSDALRCALNGWCYWTLRGEGMSKSAATNALLEQTVSAKNELLFERGINFNDVPMWQRRGIGIYWEEYTKEGFNPITRENVTALRRRLHTDFELPAKDDYSSFIKGLLDSTGEK